jgi:NTE family protein
MARIQMPQHHVSIPQRRQQKNGSMPCARSPSTIPLKTSPDPAVANVGGALELIIGPSVRGYYDRIGAFEDNTPEHIMASGALPPGLPPIEIEKKYYWDGGVVSNTPHQWLLNSKIFLNTLVFQVDLWSADGALPQNFVEAITREKDIRYSSRTRAATDHFKEQHELRHAIAELFNKLPEKLKELPQAKLLEKHAGTKAYNIVHLIYHNKAYEGFSKDSEFSRLNMELHWKAGYKDTVNTLKHPQVQQLPQNDEAIAIYDFSRDPKNKNNDASENHSLKHAIA